MKKFVELLEHFNDVSRLQDSGLEMFCLVSELLSKAIAFLEPSNLAKFGLQDGVNGIDRLLAILNQYRQNIKVKSEEHLEALINLLDTISACCVNGECADLLASEGMEGIELLLQIFKCQKHLRRHIIKTLNRCLQDQNGQLLVT